MNNCWLSISLTFTKGLMASIYLSVCVKRASSVVIPTSVVKFSASSTFWDLLESVWREEKPPEAFEFCPEDVATICVAKDSTFSCSMMLQCASCLTASMCLSISSLPRSINILLELNTGQSLMFS